MMLGFSGFCWLLQNPGAWPAAAVPALIWSALSAGAVSVSVHWLEPWLLEWIKPWLTGVLPSWSDGLSSAGAWAITVLAGALAVWAVLLLTPTLSAPALERIVIRVEADAGLPAHQSQGFFAEFWCGLRATIFGFVLVSAVLLVTLILDSVAPVLAPLWFTIKALAAAFGMSWGLLDYALTLRGRRVRERIALMRRHAPAVLGFGLGMLPFFWLPCCLLISLPVGVVAATLLHAEFLYPGQSRAIPS